jgi:hypothetical protein
MSLQKLGRGSNTSIDQFILAISNAYYFTTSSSRMFRFLLNSSFNSATPLVERGLILEPYPVDRKTNEIKALPAFIEHLALKGVVIAFDAISTKKTVS